MNATTPEEARAELERLIHDCPDCQAARARGETPTIIAIPQERRPRASQRGQPLRWRQRKRGPRA